MCSFLSLSHTLHTRPGDPTTHMTSGLLRFQSPQGTAHLGAHTPSSSGSPRMLLCVLPIAASGPAVSHRVIGGAGKLSQAGRLGAGVLRVCPGRTPRPTLHTPASGELSPCRINNGGCQDLCLLTHQGHVNCSCRGGRVLQDDFTCQGERGALGPDGSHLAPEAPTAPAPTGSAAPRSPRPGGAEGTGAQAAAQNPSPPPQR